MASFVDLCDDSDEGLEIVEPDEVLDLTKEEPAATGKRGRKRARGQDEDIAVIVKSVKPMRNNDEAGPSNRQNTWTSSRGSLHRPPLAALVIEDQSYSLDCGCSFDSRKGLQSQLLGQMDKGTVQDATMEATKGKKKAQGNPPVSRLKLDLCNCSKCSLPLSHRDIRALLPNMDEIYSQAAGSSLTGPSSLGSHSISDLINELREEIFKTEPSTAPGRGKKTAAMSHKKSKASSGVGYGGGQNDTGTQKVTKGVKAAAKRQDANDHRIVETLASITKLLRGSLKVDNRSQPPPALIVAHVLSSSLPFILRLLLSNDSMTDIAQRQDLYRGLIDLLRSLSTSSDFVEVFLVSTRDPREDKQAPSFSSSHDDPEPPNIFMILQNINRQCAIYQRSALALGDGDDETISALSLALELSSLYDDVLSSVSLFCLSMGNVEAEDEEKRPSSSRKAKSKAEGVPESVREKRYVTELRRVQFSECDGLQEQHYFREQALKSKGGGGELMRRRLRRITEEVATLSTSLPASFDSSICLAVDSERMDLLRAVIFPACDTPYSNGAFLFDIFLPSDYPDAPPQVKFLTTGGGLVRFNPNLYADGKVCLSLLGTWAGPSWDPHTSTLLQVLVSIQAMILVSDPWYNEPGYESRVATPQGKEESRAYNESLRAETMRLAILPMVELACRQRSSGPSSSSPAPLNTFIDPIKIHVEAKREMIVQQCNEWMNEIKSSAAKSKMKPSVDKILKLLK